MAIIALVEELEQVAPVSARDSARKAERAQAKSEAVAALAGEDEETPVVAEASAGDAEEAGAPAEVGDDAAKAE
jgi:hypothetical protein